MEVRGCFDHDHDIIYINRPEAGCQIANRGLVSLEIMHVGMEIGETCVPTVVTVHGARIGAWELFQVSPRRDSDFYQQRSAKRDQK